MPADFPSMCRKFIEELPATIDETDKLLTRNKIFIDRNKDIGVLSREDAIDYGATGPILRGSDVEWDIRKAHPYGGYENFQFDIPTGTVGDCMDRYLVRMEEMRQSIRIVQQALDNMPGGEWNAPEAKIVLPEKTAVLTKMEELIHHFINVTQGINAPRARFTSLLKIRKANSVSTSSAKAVARRIASRFVRHRS